MIDQIKKFVPSFDHLIESPVGKDNHVVGYHSLAIDSSGAPLGGGLGSDKETARRIALAETIERSAFLQLKESHQKEFLIDFFPSTCGFACGFNRSKTAYRSFMEALERWAWSQWIDRKRFIPQCEEVGNLTELALFFNSFFDKVIYFKKEILIDDPFRADNCIPLELGITLCFKDGGVFPGSRVSFKGTDIWTHSFLEAWRHLKIYESIKSGSETNTGIVYKRIFHFGECASDAEKQISQSNILQWPSPKLLISKEAEFKDYPFFIWRTLFDDYVTWTEGSINRFVY